LLLEGGGESLRAEGAAIPEKQNSKIKMQNDRAKIKTLNPKP
jgi:hypothetical protein